MDRGLRYVIMVMFGLLIILLAIPLVVRVYNTGLAYNSMVVEDTHHKASSRHTIPDYYEPTLYIEPVEAYTDIIGGSFSVTIQINGAVVDPTVISKARAGDQTAIYTIKNALNQSKYHKVSGYDGNGKVMYINYIGE